MTNTTDVNAQFDAEKFAQLNAPADRLAALRAKVAAGEMTERDGGNGTLLFTVNTGWDAGETFRFDTTKMTVQANHGLDLKANGDVAFYGTDPAWWSLGRPVSKKALTGTEVLDEAGLLWTVEQTPATFTGPDGKTREVPETFINYRSDTFEPLGSVGKIYYPFQNAQAYSILDELLQYQMEVKTAGSFRGGKKVFVTAELPEGMVIKGANGVEDKVRMFINIINTHDGSGSLIAAASPWFIRCQNTARLAVDRASAVYKIRHTRGGLNKIEEARRALGIMNEYYAEWGAEETVLANTPFTSNELDGLIDEVFGGLDNDAPKRAITLDTKRREKIHEVWAVELGRLGATAFAAENAITGYLDHHAELRPRGDLKGNRLAALGQTLLEGTTDEKKSTAHKVLMTRVNR
jgi:phage/plasmid-like protein (TIGR03299 family)